MRTSRSFTPALRAALLSVALGLWAAAAPAEDLEPVSIGALRFTSHAPTFIAYEKGYFQQEGLKPEIRFFQAAQPIAVAITSGDIDYGITALTGGFYHLADKGALKIIGGLYAEHPDHPGMAVLASNQAFEAGLDSPAGLPGHSWAMTQQGSSFHYVAGLLAGANGFPLSDLSLKPLQKVGSMINAVKSGQIDAMAMVPHVAVPLDSAGAAHIIGWVRDLGDYQVTTLFTSAGNVETESGRDKTARFMTAYARAIADYRQVMLDPGADPAATDAMVDLIHKYVYTDRPREKAAPAILAGAVYMNEGAALNLADVGRQLAWFQSEGLAPDSLELKDIVDTSWVEILK